MTVGRQQRKLSQRLYGERGDRPLPRRRPKTCPQQLHRRTVCPLTFTEPKLDGVDAIFVPQRDRSWLVGCPYAFRAAVTEVDHHAKLRQGKPLPELRGHVPLLDGVQGMREVCAEAAISAK